MIFLIKLQHFKIYGNEGVAINTEHRHASDDKTADSERCSKGDSNNLFLRSADSRRSRFASRNLRLPLLAPQFLLEIQSRLNQPLTHTDRCAVRSKVKHPCDGVLENTSLPETSTITWVKVVTLSKTKITKSQITDSERFLLKFTFTNHKLGVIDYGTLHFLYLYLNLQFEPIMSRYKKFCSDTEEHFSEKRGPIKSTFLDFYPDYWYLNCADIH